MDRVAFQSCDFEGLPTTHRVPTTNDERAFEAYLIPIEGGLNATAAGAVALPVVYASGGAYLVALSSEVSDRRMPKAAAPPRLWPC